MRDGYRTMVNSSGYYHDLCCVDCFQSWVAGKLILAYVMIFADVKVKKGLSHCFDACAHVIAPLIYR